MGNRVICMNELRNTANILITQCNENIDSLRAMFAPINSFRHEGALSGQAWNALKHQIGDYHLIISALIGAYQSVIEDATTLRSSVYETSYRLCESSLTSMIDLEVAEVNRLEDQNDTITTEIGRLQRNLSNMPLMAAGRGMIDNTIACLRSQIRDNDDTIGTLEDNLKKRRQRLDLLDRLASGTERLFTRANTAFDLATQGINAVTVAWNGGGFTINAVASWRVGLKNFLREDFGIENMEDIQNSELLLGVSRVSATDGDPVNMSTGNFLYKKADIEIEGASPLQFQRFYNSLGTHVGSLGRGWSHNYEIQLVKTETYAKVFYGEDGHSEYYIFVEKKEEVKEESKDSSVEQQEIADKEKVVAIKGYYKADAFNKFSTLEEDEDGNFTLITKEKMVYRFTENGQVKSITDRNGSTTNFTYTETDMLLEKVSTDSGSLSFSYEEDNLSTVTDHTGRTCSYSYADGLLKDVTNPLEEVCAYTYDKNNLLATMTNAAGVTTVTTTFDEEGRASKQVFPDESIMEYRYDEKEKLTEFVRQDGSFIRYEKDEKGKTTGVYFEDGSKEKTSFIGNQREAFFNREEVREYLAKYDEKDNLISVENAHGVTTELEYTEDNQLEKISVDSAIKLKTTFDETGNLTAITDGNNQQTSLSYLPSGKIEIITLPDGGQISLTYDNRFNITKITNPLGETTENQYDTLNRLTATTDSLGRTTSFAYDLKGNLLRLTNAKGDTQKFTYNKSNKVTQVENFDGSSLRCEYNSLGKPIKIIDQLGRETSMSYDKRWNVNHVIEPNGAEAKLSYDKDNNLVKVIKADGNTIHFKYDKLGNRTAILDEVGNTVEVTYDKLNQVTSTKDQEGNVSRYEYNADGKVTKATDPLGNETSFTYDNVGQLLTETNPLGQTRTYTYTSLGKIETVTNEAGLVTEYLYEAGGRLKGVVYPDNTKEAYIYDKVGNLVSHTARTGQTQTYAYDALNRVTTITNSQGATKEYAYDAMSNVTSVTDELGNQTSYQYSLTGKLTKVIDPSGHETAYGYDVCDRLIEVRQLSLGMDLDLERANELNSSLNKDQANGLIKDLQEYQEILRLTTYERDLLGNVTAVIDPLGQRETYSYNAKGQLSQKIDKDGFITNLEYTNRGEIQKISYADDKSAIFSHNALGQLIKVKDWLGETNITVDQLGRTKEVSDHKDRVVTYDWGILGEKRSMTYPDGMKVSYNYDDLYRLIEVDDGTNKTNYSYDNLGRLIQKQIGKDTTSQYSYNDLGQLAELNHFAGKNITTENLVDSYQYAYDLLGNKTNITKNRQGLAEDSGVFNYFYDPLNRLEKVSKDDKLLRAYSYDAFGNRTSLEEQGNKTDYTYNALNQLTSTTDAKGENQTFTYDKRGNLTEIYKGQEQVNAYAYGALNRLEKAYNFTTDLGATYSYNGLGHRIGKIEGASTESVLPTTNLGQLSLNPTKEIEDTVDLTKQFHNLLERNEDGQVTAFSWDFNVISASKHNQHFSYLQDDLGSPIRLFGDQGSQQDVLGYDEFGNDLSPSNNFQQPFTFTGYQSDPVSGNYYAQARQYNPQVGQFASHDMHWNITNMIYGDGVAGIRNASLLPNDFAIKQSGNVYGYALNNPISYADPIGKEVWLVHGTTGLLVRNNREMGREHWQRNGCTEFTIFLGDVFDQRINYDFAWPGGNSSSDRAAGAQELARKIAEQHEENPNEPIRIIGYSHGGNVAIEAVNILANMGIQVETLITLATPNRLAYSLNNNVSVSQFINVYNRSDSVQSFGGIDTLLTGNFLETVFDYMTLFSPYRITLRIRLGAENIRVTSGVRRWIWSRIGHNHRFMNDDINVWETYILPNLELSSEDNCQLGRSGGGRAF